VSSSSDADIGAQRPLQKNTGEQKTVFLSRHQINKSKESGSKVGSDLARIIDATEHLQDSARWFSMRFSLFDDEATVLTLILKGPSLPHDVNPNKKTQIKSNQIKFEFLI
jgi:hypothetical protein